MNISAAEAQTDLERLGDEIAVLSAHLDAATARLLDLIREFDARGGWGNGFRSCCLGAWDSRRARPGSTSGWPAPSARCLGCRRRSPAANCPMPRSAS